MSINRRTIFFFPNYNNCRNDITCLNDHFKIRKSKATLYYKVVGDICEIGLKNQYDENLCLKAAFHPCINVYIYKPINRSE